MDQAAGRRAIYDTSESTNEVIPLTDANSYSSPKAYLVEEPSAQLNDTTRKGTTTIKENTKEFLKSDDFLDDINAPASDEEGEK
jgi:hypothetical protein